MNVINRQERQENGINILAYPIFERLVGFDFANVSGAVFGVLFLGVLRHLQPVGPADGTLGAEVLFVLQLAVHVLLEVARVGDAVNVAQGAAQEAVGRSAVRSVDGMIGRLAVDRRV